MAQESTGNGRASGSGLGSPRLTTALRLLVIFVALHIGPAGAELRVAITIDALPRGGDGGERSLEAVLEARGVHDRHHARRARHPCCTRDMPRVDEPQAPAWAWEALRRR